MSAPQNLTPEEQRALGIAALTAVVTTLASSLVTWAIDEIEARVKRDEKDGEP